MSGQIRVLSACPRVMLLVIFLITCGQFTFADPSVLAPLSHDLIIQDCQILFYAGTAHTYSEDEERAYQARVRFERKRLPYAKQYFDGMTAAQLGTTLEPRIKRLKPGSDAYTSIAYVLAEHGVDIRKNLERMKTAGGPGSTEETEALVPIRMLDIYEKHKQDFVLDEFYSVEADGELGEVLDTTRAYLITQFPLHIARYFSLKRNGAKRLVDEFKGPALDYQAWEEGQNALRHVARNTDPNLANFARACLRLMAHDKEMTPAEIRSEKADDR